MNERIKTLWFEAAESTNGDSWAEQTAFMERFAELIVKECIEWCDAHATINGTAQQIRESIKKDFGVGE